MEEKTRSVPNDSDFFGSCSWTDVVMLLCSQIAMLRVDYWLGDWYAKATGA